MSVSRKIKLYGTVGDKGDIPRQPGHALSPSHRVPLQRAQDRRLIGQHVGVPTNTGCACLPPAMLPALPGSALLVFCFCPLSLSFLGLGMLRRSLKLPLLVLLALSCEKPG